MRRLAISFLLIAIFGFVSVGRAQADGNDNFIYEFGGNTFTWQLPATPNVGSDYVPGQFFYIPDVPYSENGIAQSPSSLVFYSSLPGIGGGFELYNGGTYLINAFGAQVYNGLENSPTFVPGTYELNNSSATGLVGTLVISTIVSTPEPGTSLLLSVGMLSLLGLARRKLRSEVIERM